MGYTTSTVHGIEVPDSSEANDVPEDIGKVVAALEGGSIVRRLTSAQIAALTGPEKPAGLVVYNTTTGKLMISDGSAVAEAYGVWQSFTPTLTASTTNPTGWTVTGRYTRIGDLIAAQYRLTAGGSMTAGSGVYSVALPVAADTTIASTLMPVGPAYLRTSGGSIHNVQAVLGTASTVTLNWPAAVGGGAAMNVAHNSPWSWVSGDTISGLFTYEAA